MTVFALDLYRLPLLDIDVAITVQVLFAMTVDTGHPLVKVKIGLQVVIVLAVQFALLATRSSPWSPVTVAFHGADIAHACATATVVAVYALSLIDLVGYAVEHGAILLGLINRLVSTFIKTCVGVENMTCRTAAGTVITITLVAIAPQVAAQTLVAEIIIGRRVGGVLRLAWIVVGEFF